MSDVVHNGICFGVGIGFVIGNQDIDTFSTVPEECYKND